MNKVDKSNYSEHNDPERWWKERKKHWEDINEVNDAKPTNPVSTDADNIDRKAAVYSFYTHFKIQLVISIIIFIFLALAALLDQPIINKGRAWLHSQMNQALPFVELAAWYEKKFSGSPSFIPSFGNKSEQVISKQVHEKVAVAPVANGIIVRSFADSLTGVEIAGKPGGEVFTIDKGRVIFVREQGDSVIIQHAEQKVSIYSKLSSSKVELNQWVEAGQVIGYLREDEQSNAALLFFAIKQDDQYIDPLDVIDFD